MATPGLVRQAVFLLSRPIDSVDLLLHATSSHHVDQRMHKQTTSGSLRVRRATLNLMQVHYRRADPAHSTHAPASTLSGVRCDSSKVSSDGLIAREIVLLRQAHHHLINPPRSRSMPVTLSSSPLFFRSSSLTSSSSRRRSSFVVLTAPVSASASEASLPAATPSSSWSL